mgnify:CR=1 FL=1
MIRDKQVPMREQSGAERIRNFDEVPLGYSPEEVSPGFNVLDVFVPADRERIARDIIQNAQGEKVPRREYMARKKDGTVFPVGIHANRVWRGQAPIGVRGILIDLTATRRAEEENDWRRAQKRYEQGESFETTVAGFNKGGLIVALKTALVWSAAQSVLRLVVGFISIKVTAVYLGAPGLALVGQINNFMALAQGGVANAIQTGVIRFTAESEGDAARQKAVWRTGILLSLSLSAPLVVLVMVLAKPISRWLFDTEAYWLVVLISGSGSNLQAGSLEDSNTDACMRDHSAVESLCHLAHHPHIGYAHMSNFWLNDAHTAVCETGPELVCRTQFFSSSDWCLNRTADLRQTF